MKMAWMKKRGAIVDLFDYSCILPRMAGVQPYVIKGTRIEVRRKLQVVFSTVITLGGSAQNLGFLEKFQLLIVAWIVDINNVDSGRKYIDALFRLSKILVLYDLVLVLTHLLIDIILLYLSVVEQSNLTFVSWLIRVAQQAASTCTIAISLFWVIRSKPTLQNALNELVKFEEILRPKSLCLSARLVGLIYATLLAIGLTDFFLLSSTTPFLIRLMISARFHFSTWMMFSISSNFTSMIKIVEQCYLALSESIVTDMKASQNLKDTQKAAEHLVSACEALNATFGPQMLLITSASFLLITGNIYLAIMFGITSESFVASTWIFIFTKIMIHLISSCTTAVQAADEFEKTLYRTVLDDRSGNLSQEVRSCLHFTNNRKVEFNAFGFFTINFTLAGSMIAAATTYLVILIQIGSAEKSGTNSTSSM